MSTFSRVWKPPWYVSIKQHIRCVLPEPVKLQKCLMRPIISVIIPVLGGMCLLDSEVLTTSILSKN
jgi:hypothetical protein